LLFSASMSSAKAAVPLSAFSMVARRRSAMVESVHQGIHGAAALIEVFFVGFEIVGRDGGLPLVRVSRVGD